MGRLRRNDRHLPPRMYLDGPTFYWRGYVNGKQKRVQLGQSYAAAILEYGKIEAKKAEPPQTLETLIEKFLADKRQPRAKATQKNYEIWGRQLIRGFGHFKPHQIQGHHMAKLLDEHPKRVTAQRLVGLMSNVLGFAVRIGWMPGPNPLYGFNKGKKSKREVYIPDDHWTAILANSPRWLRLYLRMSYLTALRKEDLIRLPRSAAQADGLHVPIKKTKAALVFDRSGELDAILEELKDLRSRVTGMTLFSTRHGKPFDYSTIMRNYKKAQELAGVPNYTLHDIRRKRLTDIEKVHGIQLAQRIAAHTDPKTTQGYIVNQETRVSLPSTVKVLSK